MRNDWDKRIPNLDNKTPREFIDTVYDIFTDGEIVTELELVGFDTSANAVRKQRVKLKHLKSNGSPSSADESSSTKDLLLKLEVYRREIKVLRGRIRDQVDSDIVIKKEVSFVETLRTVTRDRINPKWLIPNKPVGDKKQAIITAQLSDTHFDEYVNPAEIEDWNAYDRYIAEKRLSKFFTNTVKLAREYMSGFDYRGIVMPITGDLLSGNIHEELNETNLYHMNDSIIHWYPLIAKGIDYFASEFGSVHVPCVVGNHGRNSKKPRMKGRVKSNYDWLIYALLANEFKDNSNVTFDVSESSDVAFKIFNTTYRMTHGDQFRGGSGIAGALSPILLGEARKRKRNRSAGVDNFDYLVIGHWHQRIMVKNVIVNGSLVGYNEYAYNMNFEYEPPMQNFWITDPTRGVTLSAPIFVE